MIRINDYFIEGSMKRQTIESLRSTLGGLCAQRDRLVQHIRNEKGDGTSSKDDAMYKSYDKEITNVFKLLPVASTAKERAREVRFSNCTCAHLFAAQNIYLR